MQKLVKAFEQFETRLRQWADARADVRAVIILGSRARVDHPADAWSDLDAWLIVDDSTPFLETSDWLNELGRVVLTFTEPTATGDATERRVLFDGGVDVDLVPVSVERVRALLMADALPEGVSATLRRGMRALVDKDGIARQISKLYLPAPEINPPDEGAFQNVVNDFWYHIVWITKKLCRGELWTAIYCQNGYLNRRCLLPLIEWHTQTSQPAGTDTWHNGRFLELWADPRITQGMQAIIAHYDMADAWRALLAAADLFGWLARETAEKLGFIYDADTAAEVMRWVREAQKSMDEE